MQDSKRKQKLIIALICNFMIVVLEIIGVVLSVERHGWKVFQFYTENSNYLTLLISVLFTIGCIHALKNKTDISRWLHVLRYISTVCLTITILVVLLVLAPMFPKTFLFLMFGNSNLYQHLLCPLLSLISFIFFENHIKLPKISIFISLIPTIIYGVICIILNAFSIITGPYPFFYIYQIPWYSSVFSILGIFIGSTFISLILYKIYNRGHISKPTIGTVSEIKI